MTAADPTAADPAASEPTHPCVRCGRPVSISAGMCDRCNPLGLADPAASQVHGTALLTIGVAILVLALAGKFALSGIGPFQATVSKVVPTAAGLDVTLTVTNQGSRAGSSTCRIQNGATAMSDAAAYFLSPQIDPGATVSFTRETSALGGLATSGLVVDCPTP